LAHAKVTPQSQEATSPTPYPYLHKFQSTRSCGLPISVPSCCSYSCRRWCCIINININNNNNNNNNNNGWLRGDSCIEPATSSLYAPPGQD